MLVAKVPPATTLMAIYAAVVSTAALGWNVYSWLKINRTKLVVEIGYEQHATVFQNRPSLRIRLVNRSGRPVEVVGIESLNAGPKFDFSPQANRQSIPLKLAPGEETTLDYDLTTLVTSASNYTLEIMLRNGLQVAARLSDGERFVSKERRLDVTHQLR